MKRKFSIPIVSIVIVGVVLSLVGMTLVSQAASVEKIQNSHRQAPEPIPATDVKIVKKTFLPPEIGKVKGKPATPPGKDKNNGPAATGILGDTTTGTKYAIVIGICDYPGTDHDICWSDGDSLNMYNALTNLYGYTSDNIYLFRDTIPNHLDITDGPATFANIKVAVDEIRVKVNSGTGGDEVVFFFSGHGADGIAQDSDKETRDEGIVVHNGTNLVVIWDGQLREWFSDFNTTRIVFVFDSCLAGGMNDVAVDGRVVNMATEETQVAYVYSKGEPGVKEGEGVFSHYFVNEGMLQARADQYDHDKDGVKPEGNDVVVEEAFDYADGIIPSIWEKQNPVISDKFTNDLLF